jgi:pimeloyl-ACP methyl ester carboxylesterase
MIRHIFCGFAACLMIAAVSVARADSSDVATWPGNKVMTGGKGYAPTPLGQVHFRDIGPRDTRVPILLLHQTPMSMVQFAEVQNIIAARGLRAITVDTPGYGMSDTPKNEVTIPEVADNLIVVLDYLKLDKVIIAGHHTGAGIATAFAGRHPNRVAAIIVHSVPLLDDAKMKKFQQRDAPFRFTPQQDGSHLSRGFHAVDEAYPTEPLQSLVNHTWMTITSFFQGRDLFPALFRYDLRPDAIAITAPGLVLVDDKDIVASGSSRMMELHPDFEFVVFSHGGEMELMNHPVDWVDRVLAFCVKHVEQ